ncbi:MAG: sulfite exporter TauE/SafE family protein [Caldilineaceae bacterium]|nr:sulfite exporter TauE/SafE family protein [Caldilineaceae bacterium]
MAEIVSGQVAPPQSVQQQDKPPVAEKTNRLVVFAHAFFFVLGFTLIFTLVGSAVGLLGQSLNQYMSVVQRLGAVLLVIFALTTIGVFRWLVDVLNRNIDMNENPAAEALASVLAFPNMLLYTEKRVAGMHQVNRGLGYMSSVLMGVTFAAGWTPCIGPILAGILLLASSSQTATQGAGLLLVYSLGLGIPFLLTGAMFSSATGLLRRLNRHMGLISVISGLLMLYVAYLLWTDSLVLLTTQFTVFNEWVFAAEDWVTGITGTGGNLLHASGLTAAVLAFSAGIISFLSPCVLPLVPAYVGYLSGAAVGARS